jgi:hypothetical protein
MDKRFRRMARYEKLMEKAERADLAREASTSRPVGQLSPLPLAPPALQPPPRRAVSLPSPVLARSPPPEEETESSEEEPSTEEEEESSGAEELPQELSDPTDR